ncbi:MAG: DUF3846 domain-containing protein [Clostridia bacterium]|nr:DUF3846 domain-containing protein [Clostridia bacterium]
MHESTLTVLRIAPGKAPEAVTIKNTLEALQAEVGGEIEAIYPFPEEAAVVAHGEAKLIGLPLNRALTDDSGVVYDIIAGTFLVVGLKRDNFASLPPELQEKFAKRFARPEAFVRMDGKIAVIHL